MWCGLCGLGKEGRLGAGVGPESKEETEMTGDVIDEQSNKEVAGDWSGA